jgi:hypothetical protein
MRADTIPDFGTMYCYRRPLSPYLIEAHLARMQLAAGDTSMKKHLVTAAALLALAASIPPAVIQALS